MVKIPTMTCQHCSFKWSPRVANPAKCPRCQRRLDREYLTPLKRKEDSSVKLGGIIADVDLLPETLSMKSKQVAESEPAQLVREQIQDEVINDIAIGQVEVERELENVGT